MQHAALATLALAGCLLGATTPAYAADAGERPMAVVSGKLKAESRKGRVLVHVSIDNRGTRPVYVPKNIAAEKELWGPFLEVYDAVSGEAIEYIGIKVKRGALTADDYLAVKPNSVRRNTIDITDSFAFRPGQHGYRVSYSGTYLADVSRLDATHTLEFAPAAFTHAAK